MNNFKRICLSVGFTLCAVQMASSALLDGGLSMAGGVTFNSGNINTATAFSSFTAVEITSVSGDFAGAGVTLNTPGSVAMNAFSFNPFPVAGVIPWWQTVTGTYVRFDVTALDSRAQPGNNTLSLFGEGTVYMTGYDPTPGAWILTSQGLGGTFSFSSSHVAVPEPSSLALLLLAGCLGLCRQRT